MDLISSTFFAFELIYYSDYLINRFITLEYVQGVLHVTQRTYTESVLKKTGMEFTKGSTAPTIPDDETEDPETPTAEEIKQAQEEVGSLIWLSSRSRADIAYSVSRAASLILSKPKAAVRRTRKILKYLKITD